MDIADNLSEVRLRINQSAERVGRNPGDVKLLAVSKTIAIDVLGQAYEAGQRVFAENRVQECMLKVPQMPDDCEWHLIGRLQTNKVKYLNGITMIHSLDRLPLLEELERQGLNHNYRWQALLQVNIARDQSKAGLLREEVEDFLVTVLDHPHVYACGLMTIGALEASPTETRDFFRELRGLRDQLQARVGSRVDLSQLSMGMSQDYEIAVEEGATMVRVGRQIFGTR